MVRKVMHIAEYILIKIHIISYNDLMRNVKYLYIFNAQRQPIDKC